MAKPFSLFDAVARGYREEEAIMEQEQFVGFDMSQAETSVW